VAECGKEIGDHGLGIKDGVAEDSILGSWSEVRSLERRLPKIAAPGGDAVVYAASGVAVPEAS
jgi:hypothetical protein